MTLTIMMKTGVVVAALGGIPFERPDEFVGRRLEDVTPAELAKIVQQRQQQTIERAPTLSEFPGATSPMHWFENYNAVNSRAWLVVDPPEGRTHRRHPRRSSVRPLEYACHEGNYGLRNILAVARAEEKK